MSAYPQAKGGELARIEGYVWCNDHGCIHEDTTDPYDEERASWCRKAEHRIVYQRLRRGDFW